MKCLEAQRPGQCEGAEEIKTVMSEKHQEPQFDTVKVKSKQKLVTLKKLPTYCLQGGAVWFP